MRTSFGPCEPRSLFGQTVAWAARLPSIAPRISAPRDLRILMASTLSLPPALPRGRAHQSLYSYMGRLWRIHQHNGLTLVEPCDPENPPDRVLIRLSRSSRTARQLIKTALCVQEPEWAKGAMLAAPGLRRKLPNIPLCHHHVWIYWPEIWSLESALLCIPYQKRPKLIHATRLYRIRPSPLGYNIAHTEVTDESASD